MPHVPPTAIVARRAGLPRLVQAVGMWAARPVRIRMGVHVGYFALSTGYAVVLVVVLLVRR